MDKKVITIDPESFTMRNSNGFVQGATPKAVASED